jgi:SAM-dependent methyltransferase
VLHQLARYAAVAPLIDELGGGELLDVGSGSEGVAGWISAAWTVTALDRSFDTPGAMPGPRAAAARLVVGDARRLPFEDRAFDVVLALDVLEHLEPGDRHRVIDELIRTTRRRLIVACPTGKRALETDGRLRRGLERRDVAPAGWLVEHLQNGFPDASELLDRLRPHGAVSAIANENLRWHELLFSFEFRRPGFHLSRAISARLARGRASTGLIGALSRFGTRVVQGPRSGPSYRTIAVLDLDLAKAAEPTDGPRQPTAVT